jgi:regulatory protein YycI of two-component signal transduction system YycFG
MLNSLLEKLGLTYDSLNGEEKRTYDTMAKTLALPDRTTDDIRKFFAAEAERAQAELRNYENDSRKTLFYQVYATLAVNVLAFIDGPSQQREAVRAQLKQRFHIDI